MNIKELHIRNIASIEKADINFEKDLNEPYNGTPAPIFLISGDTGAGKSVILDAIAMALYKTTPRLSGVNNTTNNEFVNAAGEKVRVASIQQYTRLGIAPKEECYSMVVFEGNDGKTYTAKLSLGLYKGNKNAEGISPIKYNKPEWLLMVDGHSYSKDGDIRKMIIDAVGLSFDQFSRMAMLAQGEFASFLTGDKEKRETILERLTNTKHFTDYGNAIANLHKQAKGHMISCKDACKLEEGHIMKEKDLVLLLQEKQEKEKQKNELSESISALGQQITQLDLIETNQKAIGDAHARLTRLEDTTTLQATFATLASDLVDRERKLDTLNEAKKEDDQWLEARKEQEELYTKSGEYLLQLNQLKEKSEKIKRLEQQKKAAEGQVNALQTTLKTANEQVEQARQAVASKQKAIDERAQQRTALHPEEINQRLGQFRDEKAKLEQLQSDIQQYNQKYKTLQELLAEIEDDKKTLETRQQTLKQKEEALQQTKEAYERANAQYVTMGSSIEETMVALRQRLVKDHVKTCPLCGQGIAHELLSTDDFKHIITPLEEEKNRCKQAMDEAEKERKGANSAYDTFKGTVDNKEKQATRQQEENKKEHQRIVGVADSLHLDREQKYPTQIEARLKAVEDETTSLNQSWEKAETLQKEINSLIEQRKPLDKAKEEADKAQMNATKAFESNDKDIKDYGTQIADAEMKKTELTTLLSAALKPVYPDWVDDIEATKTRLDDAAKEYKAMKTRRDDKAAKAQQTKVLIDSIRNIKGSLIEKHPEWNVAYNGAEHPSFDITKEWSSLLADVSQNLSDIASQRTAIINAQKAIQAALTELKVEKEEDRPNKEELEAQKGTMESTKEALVERLGAIQSQLDENAHNQDKVKNAKKELEKAEENLNKWDVLNEYFGGTRFRTLVQTHVLRPLLNNANIYLEKITKRYELTCSEENEQLSILVLDNDNKKQVRSATLLSGGERFMVSLALSLALSSLNRPDLNVNILFIDEGFGTLDEKSLDSVMETLGKLQEIAGLQDRRVGIISHRSELEERLPVQIRVEKRGEGRSQVTITNM